MWAGELYRVPSLCLGALLVGVAVLLAWQSFFRIKRVTRSTISSISPLPHQAPRRVKVVFGDADPERPPLQFIRWTAWERRHGYATCRRPSGAFMSGTPPARCRCACSRPCAHQQHQSSELARRTWQELARWAMAAQQQQHSASVPASAPALDCLPRGSTKRAHGQHEEPAKRSRPLAELQA